MATLKSGTAAQLSERLLQLADWGASKHPPADSVLADAVAGARRYADYLQNVFGPMSGGIVIKEGSEVFATADALAELLVEEGTSGAYADSSPPPDPNGVPWLPLLGAAAGLGVLGYLAGGGGKRRGRGRRRGGFLAAVGL